MGGTSAANLARVPISNPQSNQRTPRGKADSVLCQGSLVGKKEYQHPLLLRKSPSQCGGAGRSRWALAGSRPGTTDTGKKKVSILHIPG